MEGACVCIISMEIQLFFVSLQGLTEYYTQIYIVCVCKIINLQLISVP